MEKIIDKRNEYKNNIKGVQYILLNILKIFIDICEKNDITYWVDSGTLLGTIRHNGFIPWDDDIDVCVPREEILKLKQILKKELPSDLFLQDFETDNGITEQIIRIRDRYSRTELKKTEYHNGISIDIFPMDGIKENIITKNLKYIFLLGKTKLQTSEFKGIKKYIVYFRNIFGINKKNVYYHFSKNKKENKAYAYFECEYWGYIFSKSKIYPLKKAIFEDIYVNIPQDYDYYLKKLYGKNYMKLPKEQNRQIHHILENVSLTEPCIHKESLIWKNKIK